MTTIHDNSGSYYGNHGNYGTGSTPRQAKPGREGGPSTMELDALTLTGLQLATGQVTLDSLPPAERQAYEAAAAGVLSTASQSITVDIVAVLALIQKTATKLKEAAGLERDSASYRAVSSHLDAAQKAMDSAKDRWRASMAEGSMAIAGGVVETGMASGSLYNSHQAGKASMQQQDHLNTARAEGLKAGPGQLTTKEANKVNKLQQQIADLNAKRPANAEGETGGPGPAANNKRIDEEILAREQEIADIYKQPQKRAESIADHEKLAAEKGIEAATRRSQADALSSLGRGISQILKGSGDMIAADYNRKAGEADAEGKIANAAGEGFEAISQRAGELATQFQSLLQSAMDTSKAATQTDVEALKAAEHV